LQLAIFFVSSWFEGVSPRPQTRVDAREEILSLVSCRVARRRRLLPFGGLGGKTRSRTTLNPEQTFTSADAPSLLPRANI
jgi:hypothetical protein